MRRCWKPYGAHVTAAGPSLTLPYPAALRAALRGLLDRAAELDPVDPALLDGGRAP